MKFGLYVPPFDACADPTLLAELASEAEGAGWEGFFIYDHIARDGDIAIADPWIALAAISTSTKRLRLGALVTPLPRRRPWKVAREAATLDVLSGGRLVLGVGAGHRKVEFAAFGETGSARTRASMLDEGLEILVGLWQGDPFTFHGDHYDIDNALFLPRPVQRPRIPIWVGGRWPVRQPFLRAARWDGVFPLPLAGAARLSTEDIRSISELVVSHRQDGGAFDVVYSGRTGDGAADRSTVRAFGDAGATWWLEDLHPQRFGSDRLDPATVPALRRRIATGPPSP